MANSKLGQNPTPYSHDQKVGFVRRNVEIKARITTFNHSLPKLLQLPNKTRSRFSKTTPSCVADSEHFWIGQRSFVLRFDTKSAKQVLFKSEDVMQQRSPRIAWFRSVKGLQERNAKTVEPSVTVAAPIAMNAK
jgi:hypothetical protein